MPAGREALSSLDDHTRLVLADLTGAHVDGFFAHEQQKGLGSPKNDSHLLISQNF